MNAGTIDIRAQDAMPEMTIKVRLVGVRATIFRIRLGMVLLKLAARLLRSEILVDMETPDSPLNEAMSNAERLRCEIPHLIQPSKSDLQMVVLADEILRLRGENAT